MTTFATTILLLALAIPGFAQGSAKAPSGAKAATPAAKNPADPNTPPAGAEKIGESVWRHKDKEGKTFIYMRTPFGFMKVDEETYRRESTNPEEAKSRSQALKVVAQTSDTVTFETITPFGKQRWERKKSELTPTEKAALESIAQPARSKE